MILDADEKRILSGSTALDSAEVEIYPLKIQCEAGYYLRSNTVDLITVEARKGSLGGWTNLETTPIDLSADAGTVQDYEIRLTAAVIAARDRKLVQISVGK